ncbi:archaeosortase/exosortase family protein [Chloroflexota bacterium]
MKIHSENVRILGDGSFALGSLRFGLGAKLVLWFLISMALSLILFRDFWASLGIMLSPDWIFGQYHAAPWGVLALCLIFLWLKRKELRQEMSRRISLIFVIPGAALVGSAIFIPSYQDFLVFQVLLASLGAFVIFFGWGARIPSILLGIYVFAISFPLLIQKFAELPYSMSAIKPLVWIMTGLGFAFENEGQLIHFTTFSGEPISVAVTSACAGPATMGVFLSIFALMTLDMPLRPKKAGYMFLFGVGGTWLQSIIRLLILMVVAYYLGERAMWMAHSWTIYILFPLWYLIFVYIYFRQTGHGHQARDRR